MTALLRWYLKVLAGLTIISCLGQLGLPAQLAAASAWGVAPGWQREIAFWDLAMYIVIVRTLRANDAISGRTVAIALTVLQLLVATNHVVAAIQGHALLNTIMGVVNYGCVVRNGGGDGILVADSATAVIITTTVTGNTNGITVRNGASARIGIDENTVLAGNTISGNRRIGIQVSEGASADIGGNTINANGKEGIGSRFGISVSGASGLLACGGNTIENNPFSGITAFRGSNIIVGAVFGAIPTGNTIRRNGAAGLPTGKHR